MRRVHRLALIAGLCVLRGAAADADTFTIVDGQQFGDFIVHGSDVVNMTGGLGVFLSATDTATVNFSGGTLSAFTASANGTAKMTGGTAAGVVAVGNAHLEVTGGLVTSSVQLFD